MLATPKQQEQQERFTELCNYISSHCTESLSLEDLANEAGFSKYHFARLFKEMTGTTCHNFVLGRRIIYAKNLLMDFSLPITEVAMRAGFNSLATFNRIFKAQIGCTPVSSANWAAVSLFPEKTALFVQANPQTAARRRPVLWHRGAAALFAVGCPTRRYG